MPLHRSQYRGQCQCPFLLSPSSVREHRNNSRRSDAMFPMLMMIMMMTSGHAYVPPSCSSFSHHQHRRSSSLRRVQSFDVKNSVTRQRKKRFQYWSVTNNNDEIQDEQQSYNVVKTMSPDTSNESKLDNLIPSSMMPSSRRRNNSFVAANTGAGRMDTNRRHTGLSSSVLLPSSLSSDDSDTTLQPLFFQSTNPSSTDSLDVSISKNSDSNNNNGSWKERLLDVSNFASLLCVLDCTLLPLVSIAIPAISWGLGFILGSGGALSTATTIPPALTAFLAYLPALSHGIALYFVIPVGLLTTIINYFFGHREVKFSMAALFGVALIYVANSSAGVGIPSIDAMLHSAGIVAGGVHDHAGHVHNACGAMVGAATNMMAHTCPEGWAHRMTNTLGCAFLLGSNYASRKYMEEKNSGCAASALAEAWGGDSGRQVCPPGCGCEKPSFGTKGSSSRAGGEMFFQWERKSPVSERSSRFRR